MFIPVENNPHLVRDSNSKAILNVSVSGLEAYKKEREHRLKIKSIIENHDKVTARLDNVEDKLNKILSYLENK